MIRRLLSSWPPRLGGMRHSARVNGIGMDPRVERERNVRHRLRILDLATRLPALHIAPAFSCIELVDTCYFHLMDDGDRFILSKGHGAMAQYAVLTELGVISEDDFLNACQSGSHLGGHPDRGNPGILASTGSLGHGLPIALGVCLGDRELGSRATTFVVVGDGELMEGSMWEAILLAPTLGLSNLVVLVDHNGSIARGHIRDVHPNLLPLVDKFTAFGWQALEVDAHRFEEIMDAHGQWDRQRPLVIVGHSIKGKGVSFMEGNPIWAYRSPSAEEYQIAVAELRADQSQRSEERNA